jgi:putative FmdB family regulatory protein
VPTYDYVCDGCRHRFEHFQGIREALLTTCPACRKKKLRRLIGAGAGILFKGSGFYETDYKRAAPGGAKASRDGGDKRTDTSTDTSADSGTDRNTDRSADAPAKETDASKGDGASKPGGRGGDAGAAGRSAASDAASKGEAKGPSDGKPSAGR